MIAQVGQLAVVFMAAGLCSEGGPRIEITLDEARRDLFHS